jgi:YVTN family beta-propeller protein
VFTLKNRTLFRVVSALCAVIIQLVCTVPGMAQTSTASSGLVAHWTFNGNVTDSVGNHNPSATNAITFAVGKVGQGAKIGTGGFIDVPDSADLRNQKYTIEAWVRPDGPGPNDDESGSNLIDKPFSRPRGEYEVTMQLGWRAYDGRFVYCFGNIPGGHRMASARSFPAGNFHHVAATYDGAVFRLFVNGVLEGERAHVKTVEYDSQAPWVIGATPAAYRNDGWPRTWNGVIDEVKIYNRALSEAEVKAEFNTSSSGVMAYVSFNDYLTVIDTTKVGSTEDPVVATITGIHGASGVRVSPDGKRVYVAERYSNTVAVIDAGTNSIIKKVPVGVNPHTVIFAPDGSRAYVSNRADDSVSVIDTNALQVIKTIPVGRWPTGMAIAPNGSRIYVTNYAAGTVSVVEAATNSVVATIDPQLSSPDSIAVARGGSRVYVVGASDHATVIDTATNAIKKVYVADVPGQLTTSPDCTRLYLTHSLPGGPVSVIDTVKEQRVDWLTQVVYPGGLATTPDGKYVYAAETATGKVVVVDTTNKSVVRVQAGPNNGAGGGPFAVAISGGASYCPLTANHTINIDPGTYKGKVILVTDTERKDISGQKTLQLAPGNYGIDNGNTAGNSVFGFTVDQSGQVVNISNPASASANGSTLTLKNTTITINPQQYPGGYYLNSHRHTNSPADTGVKSFVVIPGLYDSIDNGSFAAAVGAYSNLGFVVGGDGQINSIAPSASATANGNVLILGNVPVRVDPTTYSGTYTLGGITGLSGKVNTFLIPGLATVVYALGQAAYVVPSASGVNPSSVTLNLSGQSHVFRFTDTQPPVITAPADVTASINTQAQGCGAVVSDEALGQATATDDSGTANVSRSGVPTGNIFPVGTTIVTYTATDGGGNTATATQKVTVTDKVAPVITLNGVSPATVEARTAYADAGATASDNCTSQVQVTAAGQVDVNKPGSYTITYTATDAAGNTATASRVVKVVDTTAPKFTSVPAEVVTPGNILGSCSANVSLAVATASDDVSAVTVVGVRSDDSPLGAAYPLGTTTVVWTATDASGNKATAATKVTVTNPGPAVTITGPATGTIYPVGTAVTFNGQFTDNPGGSHKATWTFDTISQAGAVNETTGAVSGSYTFTTPGVYLVTLTVEDGCGATGSASTVDGLTAMVVIYDPNGGWVTGGGWINSPAGAYTANPALAGKANFGFVSKYEKGANVPTGNTEFHFKVANFTFKSTSYEWLVVAGGKAQYKGSGTVNGGGEYGFLLTAVDGDRNGGGGSDKFRIKIWDKTKGDGSNGVVYDNLLNAPDSNDPTTVLGGGNIVIHSDK